MKWGWKLSRGEGCTGWLCGILRGGEGGGEPVRPSLAMPETILTYPDVKPTGDIQKVSCKKYENAFDDSVYGEVNR